MHLDEVAPNSKKIIEGEERYYYYRGKFDD